MNDETETAPAVVEMQPESPAQLSAAVSDLFRDGRSISEIGASVGAPPREIMRIVVDGRFRRAA